MGTVDERRCAIENMINERGNITFVELKEEYPKVSEMTLRTDLKYLDHQKRIVRIHGGAKSVKDVIGVEDSLQMRTARHMVAKKAIARKACSLIPPGQTVFLDAGSTTTALAEVIPHQDNLIVTNGISCAMKLSLNPCVRVMMPGGNMDAYSMGLCGINAVNQLSQMNFDLAFLSAAGVHPERGFTCANENEAVLKKTIIKRAKKTIILMDSSKFNTVSTFSFSHFKEIDGLVSETYEAFIEDLCLKNSVVMY